MGLEKKITKKYDKKMYEKFLEAKEYLEPYSFGMFDTYWKGYVEDYAFKETQKYVLLAAKWHGESWLGHSGGTEWKELCGLGIKAGVYQSRQG